MFQSLIFDHLTFSHKIIRMYTDRKTNVKVSVEITVWRSLEPKKWLKLKNFVEIVVV